MSYKAIINIIYLVLGTYMVNHTVCSHVWKQFLRMKSDTAQTGTHSTYFTIEGIFKWKKKRLENLLADGLFIVIKTQMQQNTLDLRINDLTYVGRYFNNYFVIFSASRRLTVEQNS